MEPGDAVDYLARGYAESKLGQYAKAIDDFGKAIECNQKYAEAYYFRGIAKGKLVRYIEVSLRTESTTATTLTAKGKLERDIEASRDGNGAISLWTNAKTYFSRVLVSLGLGQYAQAIQDLEKARDQDLEKARKLFKQQDNSRIYTLVESTMKDVKKRMAR